MQKAIDALRSARLFAPRHERTFFDSSFYLSAYCDVRSAKIDAFEHYMEHGWREGRDPSAVFKTLYYRDTYLVAQPVNPLTHYVDLQRTNKSYPKCNRDFILLQEDLVSSLFDFEFYQMQVGSIADNLLHHYLEWGWRLNLSPNPEFDVACYIQHTAYIYRLGVSPLYHYASQRRLKALIDGVSSISSVVTHFALNV